MFFRTDFRLACDHCKLHVIYDFFGFWNLFKQQQLLNKSNSSSNCMLLFACLPSKCREKLMKVNIDIKNTLILKFQSSLLWNWFFTDSTFFLGIDLNSNFLSRKQSHLPAQVLYVKFNFQCCVNFPCLKFCLLRNIQVIRKSETISKVLINKQL